MCPLRTNAQHTGTHLSMQWFRRTRVSWMTSQLIPPLYPVQAEASARLPQQARDEREVHTVHASNTRHTFFTPIEIQRIVEKTSAAPKTAIACAAAPNEGRVRRKKGHSIPFRLIPVAHCPGASRSEASTLDPGALLMSRGQPPKARTLYPDTL